MILFRLFGWLLPVPPHILLWLLRWIVQLALQHRLPQTAPTELKTAQAEPRAAQPGPHPIPKQNQPMCFRISGIPPLWDRERLEKALQTIDPDFDLKRAEVSGPFPDCYDPPSQVALLNLSGRTSYFTLVPNQEKHGVINENGEKVRLAIDKHFYDLTPLNRAEQPINMELVNPQKDAFQMLICVSTA